MTEIRGVPSANAHQNQLLDSKIVSMDRDISLPRLKKALRTHHRGPLEHAAPCFCLLSCIVPLK